MLPSLLGDKQNAKDEGHARNGSPSQTKGVFNSSRPTAKDRNGAWRRGKVLPSPLLMRGDKQNAKDEGRARNGSPSQTKGVFNSSRPIAKDK